MLVLRCKVLRLNLNPLVVLEHKCNTLFPMYQTLTLSQESRYGVQAGLGDCDFDSLLLVPKGSFVLTQLGRCRMQLVAC